jgi:hypothetical protein
MKRIRRTSAQWHELLKNFEVSNSRATDFCHKHNIDPKYFSKKKSEYKSNLNKPNSFVKVKVNNPSTHTPLLMSLNNKRCILNFYQLPNIEYLSDLMKSVS